MLVSEEFSLAPFLERRITSRTLVFVVAAIFLSITLFHDTLSLQTFRCTMTGFGQDASSLSNTRKPRLGDGCYHVYIDAGANIGVHTRFLFEPELYPNAEVARQLFNTEFGEVRDNRDFCSFGFEPNPLHVEHHRQLTAAYEALGWRYHFIHAGVSDHEGNLTFYRIDDAWESMNNEWGFSMMKRNEDAIPIPVAVIDFVRWMKENIADRELPTVVYGNYTKPKVVMKVDIEGSEYIIIPRLLYSGIMCEVVDLTFGELHPADAHRMQRNATNPIEGRGEIKFDGEQDINAWSKWLLDKGFASQRLEGCPGRWRFLDDEAYVRDETPLPNISGRVVQ